MKGTVTLELRDTNNRAYTKNLPNVNPAYLPTFDSDVAIASAASIKSACVALNNLTTSTLMSIGLTTSLDITNANFEGGEYNG